MNLTEISSRNRRSTRFQQVDIVPGVDYDDFDYLLNNPLECRAYN